MCWDPNPRTRCQLCGDPLHDGEPCPPVIRLPPPCLREPVFFSWSDSVSEYGPEPGEWHWMETGDSSKTELMDHHRVRSPIESIRNYLN